MPPSFKLPTTASLAFENFFSSDTHPSLPSTASSTRHLFRFTLKKHKRITDTAKPAHLPQVLLTLNAYLPYLLALDDGLSGKPVADEEVTIVLAKEIETEWRSVLSNTPLGRPVEAPRIRLRSLEYEILFTLSTLATIHVLSARETLHVLFVTHTTPPTAEARTTAITAAVKSLLTAHSIHTYLAHRATSAPITPPPCPDVSSSTFSALAALDIAEATLVTVAKDDPYTAAVAQERNKQDNEWMYKAPTISPVRALLFARLCVAASEHAARASGLLSSVPGMTQSLIRYAEDLRGTARAKACRFLGIDAEMVGDVAKGIAWLRAAKKELGIVGVDEEVSRKKRFGSGLRELKKEWQEKREDKKVARGAGDQSWGGDAGRFEESRVVEGLCGKWEKLNDVVSSSCLLCIVQLINVRDTDEHTNHPALCLPASTTSLWPRILQ